MRTAKFFPALGGLIIALALGGCDDLIEPEITNKQVLLLTPVDSATSTSALQTFRWEPLAGARQYRIQIAAPSFERPATFFLDSTTSRTFFATSLLPGTYRWRVQALNAGYATAYSTQGFRVDSTGSLASQGIELRQPANNSVTSNVLVRFAWTPLPAAQRYLLSLTPSPRSLTATGSFDTLLATPAATVQLRLPARSQVYRWRLTALNATSTREAGPQTFELDLTPPGVPGLATPLEGAFFTALPLTLTWTRSGADVAVDSLFLYRADQTTLVSSFPRLSAAASFTVPAANSFLPAGTYFWAVRSVDRAGNASALTPKRSFILQ